MKENDVMDLMEATERLEAVAEALEEAAVRLTAERVSLAAEAQEHVGRIVATVETAREAELERKLAEAEARILALSASAASQAVGATQAAGRKTLPVGMASMLAKQGVSLDVGDGVVALEAGAIDGALASLSIEQRIAVKSELRRAGLLG